MLKFLVVEIDSCLSCKPHNNELPCRLSRSFLPIQTLSYVVGFQTLKQVHLSYFQSHISIVLFCGGTRQVAAKVVQMQKKVIRLITKTFFNTSCFAWSLGRSTWWKLGVISNDFVVTSHQRYLAFLKFSSIACALSKPFEILLFCFSIWITQTPFLQTVGECGGTVHSG